MRISSPAVTIKDIWDALTADYGAAGTYGLLVETNLDAPVSGAKADLTTLESRLTAVRAAFLDVGISSRLAAVAYTAERGTDSAALASAWTAALATALGAYTAAKAAYLDAAISSRLATASYTTERGTDSALLAANYRPPCMKWKAPATIAQASATAGQYYTILDTIAHARLLFFLFHHDMTGARNMATKITVDGRTLETAYTAVPENTTHYVYLAPTHLGAEDTAISTTRKMLIDVDVPLEGQSVKVEIKSDQSMSTYTIYAAVYYGSLT